MTWYFAYMLAVLNIVAGQTTERDDWFRLVWLTAGIIWLGVAINYSWGLQ